METKRSYSSETEESYCESQGMKPEKQSTLSTLLRSYGRCDVY